MPLPSDFNFTAPVKGEVINAGTNYTITWTPGGYTGNMSLWLMHNMTTESNYETETTIADGVDAESGTYSWVIPLSLGNGVLYEVEAALANRTAFQQTGRFQILDENGDPVATTTSSSSVAIATTSSTSIATTSTSTGVANVTSGVSEVTPTSSSTSTAGYSSGQVAGIAVGSVVGCLLLASLVGLIFYYRRKANKLRSQGGDLQSGNPVVHNEHDAHYMGYSDSTAANKDVLSITTTNPGELDSSQMSELYSTPVRSELGTAPRYELEEGGYRR